MKRKLLCATAVLISVLCMAIGASAQTKEFNKDSVTAVFLGGSITQGVGASDISKNYVSQVGEYLKTAFAGKNVNYVNAGIPGTDSPYGYYRLTSDVLSYKPDIVFIEFSVNDHYNDLKKTNSEARGMVKGYMEGIIRRLAAEENAPAVIFINTTDDKINTNAEVSFADVYETLCTRYGIKAIDLESYIREGGYVTASGAEGTILVDGTHPNDTGYKLYADEIIKELTTGTYYLVPDKNAAWLSEAAYRQEGAPRTLGYSEMNFTGDWSENSTYKGGYTAALKMSENAGDSVSFDFYGDSLCLGTRSNQYGGNFRLEIDGEFIGNYNTYNGGTWPMEFPRGTVTGLDKDKKHTARITVLGTHTSSALKDNVIIARAFVNDGYTDKAGKLVITDKALSGSLASATLYNKTESEISANALFAQYDANGALTGVVKTSAPLAPYEYTEVSNTVEANSKNIYVFVWKQGETLEPVCEKITVK